MSLEEGCFSVTMLTLNNYFPVHVLLTFLLKLGKSNSENGSKLHLTFKKLTKKSLKLMKYFKDKVRLGRLVSNCKKSTQVKVMKKNSRIT